MNPDAPKRLTTREKFSYAIGGVPFTLGYIILPQLAFPVFNMSIGISATAVGAVLAIGRLWDAFTDPLMGNISDNARSRWGRRVPFVVLGSVLLAICLPAIWSVPSDVSPGVQFAWLTATILLFFATTTMISVPWLSLGYELNPDPIERTRLQVWRSYVAGAVTLAVSWFYRWAQADIFPDLLTGLRWISAASGLICIGCALVLALNCRERDDAFTRAQPKTPFLQSVRETISNGPFLLLVLGIVTVILCMPMLVASLGLYINVYYLFDGDKKTGAAYAAAFSSMMVVLKFVILPVGVQLVKRYGKIRVIEWTLWLGLAASLLKFVIYTPAAPWLQFVNALLLGPSVAVFWLLVDPMKADCADYDEWKTGRRRSGSYAAVANWIEKASMTVTLLGSGLLLDWSGFDAALGKNQPENTIPFLRLCFATVPTLAYTIALVCLRLYPLTDARMEEIRREISSRR